MDDRIRRHAEVLVDYCTEIRADDDVLVRAPATAEELVVALYEAVGERGARPRTELRSPRAVGAYATAMDPSDYRVAEHDRAAMAEADVVVLVAGPRNAAETSGVDADTGAAASRARQPVLEERLDTRWVITRYPTAADAQRAGMGLDDWRALVYDAVDRDWPGLRDRQTRWADRLAAADELRLVSGESTDLRFSVAGMDALNDAGRENMPGGEVATVPDPDSAEGTVRFDLPVRRRGTELAGVELTFANGEVIDWSADRGAGTLEGVLETDAGARRLGELGVGMNEGIDRPTGNTLFDEKMAGTVHLALGDALEECVPDDSEAVESSVHLDLLVDARSDTRLLADGQVVYRDGAFLADRADA